MDRQTEGTGRETVNERGLGRRWGRRGGRVDGCDGEVLDWAGFRHRLA